MPFAEDVEQEGHGRAVQHLNVDGKARRAIQAQGQIEAPLEVGVPGGQMQADIDIVEAAACEERAVKPRPLHVRFCLERRHEIAPHAIPFAGVGPMQAPHALGKLLPARIPVAVAQLDRLTVEGVAQRLDGGRDLLRVLRPGLLGVAEPARRRVVVVDQVDDLGPERLGALGDGRGRMRSTGRFIGRNATSMSARAWISGTHSPTPAKKMRRSPSVRT